MSDKITKAINERALGGSDVQPDFEAVVERNRDHITYEHVVAGLHWFQRPDRRDALVALLKAWAPNDLKEAKGVLRDVIFRCLNHVSGLPVLVAILGEIDDDFPSVSSCHVHHYVHEAAWDIVQTPPLKWSLEYLIRASSNDDAIREMIEFLASKNIVAPTDGRHVCERLGERLGERVVDLIMCTWVNPDAPRMDIKPALRRKRTVE